MTFPERSHRVGAGVGHGDTGTVSILLELQPKDIQCLGRMVGVTQNHGTMQRSRQGIEGGREIVIRLILPVVGSRGTGR